MSFGLHRVMFRPRDSHDLRVLATDLQVSPEAYVRMIQDPHSNSVALVQPMGEADRAAHRLHLHHRARPAPMYSSCRWSRRAEFLPFAYSVQERLDLEHYLRPHHDDPEGTLIRWAHQFLHADKPNRTREVLTRMNAHIGESLTYTARDEEGTQTPLETLALGSGSCRDYALLMMEAARRLGVATRFVSGYIYDAALDAGSAEPGATVGAGSTHAWLQAYLPGAGWVAFDPTNNLLGTPADPRRRGARPGAGRADLGSWYGEAAPTSAWTSVPVQRRC